MSKRASPRETTQGTQFRAQEEAAFHAWREWPVWLALRRQELQAHRGSASQPTTPPGASTLRGVKHD